MIISSARSWVNDRLHRMSGTPAPTRGQSSLAVINFAKNRSPAAFDHLAPYRLCFSFHRGSRNGEYRYLVGQWRAFRVSTRHLPCVIVFWIVDCVIPEALLDVCTPWELFLLQGSRTTSIPLKSISSSSCALFHSLSQALLNRYRHTPLTL